jgi:SAM-dependent methyltransferase
MAVAAGLCGRRLLDVACGTGKSFLPYLERGYEVTACDISPAMADIAATKSHGRAQVLVEDMRTLPRLGSFDLVCCIDDAVNNLLTQEELVATLAGLRRNLAHGGVVVFDTNTLMAYRSFFANSAVVPGDEQVLLWDGHETPAFQPGDEAHATLTALRRGEDGWWTRTDVELAQRHYGEVQVRNAMEAAGLECAAVYGMHLDGSTDDGFDEATNSKAVYIARASAQGAERG